MNQVKLSPQLNIIKDATEALIEKLGPGRSMEFWSIIETGEGDYLRLKKKLFKGESVNSLYKKILRYEKRNMGEECKFSKKCVYNHTIKINQK